MTNRPYQKPLAEITVAIVGLGLMGGSLGLALRGQVGRVLGVALQPQTIEQALARGAIDAGCTDLATGIAAADLVVLATPVGVILQQIEAIGRLAAAGALQQGLVLLDLGSAKGAICDAMQRLPAGVQAMGGHPMCGKERSGLAAAAADLYQGAPFVLVRPRPLHPQAAALAESLVRAVGARPIELESGRHDRLVAAISHLPYVLALALFATAADVGREDEAVWRLAAGGFRSATRLAGSHERMMADILLTNRDAVLAMIDSLRANLDAIAELIAAADEAHLLATAAAARAQRSQFLEQHGQ